MPIPITARGAKMLKDELQRLKTQDRPAVVQAIAEAREKGDLSENAEYDAARESQAFIEGRILELESKIAQFQVIDPTTLPDNGKVVFSATVTIEDRKSTRLNSSHKHRSRMPSSTCNQIGRASCRERV